MTAYGVTKKDVDAARKTVEAFKQLSKSNPVAAKKQAASFLERSGITENGKPKKQIVTQGINW